MFYKHHLRKVLLNFLNMKKICQYVQISYKYCSQIQDNNLKIIVKSCNLQFYSIILFLITNARTALIA